MDDVKCTDCDGKGGSYAGPPCPSCRGTGIEQTSSEPVTYLGKKLRALAAEHGSGVTQLGTLFVRVTCHGNNWALELNDDEPVWQSIRDEWAIAVGQDPALVEWRFESNGMVVRYEWQGTEDAAPEGTKAFYLGGKP